MDEAAGLGSGGLISALEDAYGAARQARRDHALRPDLVETGTVRSIHQGIVRMGGLPGLGAEEVVEFDGGSRGLALELDESGAGVVLLDPEAGLEAGAEARRTGRVFGVPVGESLLGRIVDPAGRPLDGAGPVLTAHRLAADRDAPPLTARAPVRRPLHTGVKVVDALVPVGRGQRELILGDRGTGRTTLAVDVILAQAETEVLCVYCAIGQRDAAVRDVVDRLRRGGAMERSIVVVASGDDPLGLQYVAPYAATSMAEHFASRGRDVLVVYDDLTRHARAYRELSLLLRRPPGREAYPGDVFYLHARLLERSSQLSEEEGGGSLTALPVVETQGEDLAAYIPTNLISITDGQICLSPTLFQKGVLPALDVGRSVSRVGGQAQLPAYRAVAGDLRLAYAQFLELEVFSRFATQLDPETRQALERGRRVREVLKQRQGHPMPATEQVAVLLAATTGVLDQVPPEEIGQAERRIAERIRREHPDLCDAIEDGEPLAPSDRNRLREAAADAVGAESGED